MLENCLNYGKVLCVFIGVVVLASEQVSGYTFVEFILCKLVALFICFACYTLIDLIERMLDNE